MKLESIILLLNRSCHFKIFDGDKNLKKKDQKTCIFKQNSEYIFSHTTTSSSINGLSEVIVEDEDESVVIRIYIPALNIHTWQKCEKRCNLGKQAWLNMTF